MKIYLIGMPYSGKTTIGKKLSEMLELPFYDVNVEIEKDSLMFIDEIFNHYGLKAIFKAEEKVLKKLFDETNGVIATNANIINNRSNKKYLNGIVIYIDTDDKELTKRLNEGYPSYLLSESTIEDLNKDNFLKYRSFANHIVNGNKAIEDILIDIIDIINNVENI